MKHAARLVVMDEKHRFLLVHTTKKERDRWEVPGGKVIEEETHSAAASRELYEETGVMAIEPVFLFDSPIVNLDEEDWVVHFYWTTNYQGQAVNREPEKADGVNWFTLAQIVELKTVPVLSIIPCMVALERINGIVQYKWPMTVPADHKNDAFIQGMLDRMAQGFWTYGHMQRRHDRPDNIKNMLTRLVKYAGMNRVWDALKEVPQFPGDGNTEWLMDEANFSMMEFSVPSHPEAHYRATTDTESPGSHVAGRVVHGKHELRGPHNVRQRKEGD